jgi:glucose 1-dehydrogenase
MRFLNRVALVTGGASGIGRASACRLATDGARVVIADVDDVGATETVRLITHGGGDAVFVRTDVGELAQVEAVVRAAQTRYGRLDIMFNNAGIATSARLLDCTPEDYHRTVRVNQDGVFFGIQAAGRAMRDAGTGGVIINTGSVHAELGTVGAAAYQATKAAVRILTQAAATELAPYGIRVVAIAPGIVSTPLVDRVMRPSVAAAFAAKQLRGQMISPERVADVVCFLASDEADAINASTIFVDDGYVSFK